MFVDAGCPEITHDKASYGNLESCAIMPGGGESMFKHSNGITECKRSVATYLQFRLISLPEFDTDLFLHDRHPMVGRV